MPSLLARMLRLVVRHHLARMFDDKVSIEERRRRIKEMSARNVLVKGMAARDDTLGGCAVTWVEPTDAGPDPASAPILFYVHGGAFIVGSPRSHMFLPAQLAKGAGMRAVLPTYGLAPEHPYPKAVHDVMVAYRALRAGLREGHPVVLSGDSAGGLIALQVLLALRESGGPLPTCTLLYSPVSDVRDFDGESYVGKEECDPLFDRETLVSCARLYTVGADVGDPALCPKRANLAGLPPMFIDVGEHEVLLSDAQELAARATECGVNVTLHIEPWMWHGYVGWTPILPEANKAIARNLVWLRAQVRG